jgi:hypothetical protein
MGEDGYIKNSDTTNKELDAIARADVAFEQRTSISHSDRIYGIGCNYFLPFFILK